MAQFNGIGFPFRQGPSSFPEVSVDAQLIKESIAQILGTSPTERLMRPSFGAGVYKHVFANNDDVLAQLIESDVRRALRLYETRITVTNVTSSRSDNMIITDIDYIVLSTQQTQSAQVVQVVPTGE